MKQPKNPFHPGEILLEEFLEPAGITQTEFARKLGWARARLNELIKGKSEVTADAALDLAEALGTSAKLWMNLQATYDLDQALGAGKPPDAHGTSAGRAAGFTRHSKKLLNTRIHPAKSKTRGAK